MTRVEADDLIAFTTAVFRAHRLPEADARASAEALCHGDTTGTSSHGVANLTRIYLPLLRSGRANPDAKPERLVDRGPTLLVDGDRALGLWLAGAAMDLATIRAADYGVGVVSVRNATHFGCAGHHALRAVERGMIGLVLANCGHQRIAPAPVGGPELLGTNPLAVAAPAGRRPPFLLDMSTTTAPTGKVRAAARAGERIPSGWLAGPAGPETDPAALDAGTARLTWLGAPGPAEHKGFGLGLAVEVLAALLPGAGLGPLSTGTEDDDVGFFVMALAPDTLRDGFTEDSEALFSAVAGAGAQYPGEPESLRTRQSHADGVWIADPVFHELRAVADECGIRPPTAL
ncbi:Ldh family oxidoreductase [Actinokineospora bangkokensis]|uniref:Lactate dehydrogenase n=1 Tax=Actinokineospora bangkokensis TaxID=1193682 RepID=A0A1Q9LH04_9PSEU|nr:Ldh family oxidoreductase [Actinokineospora bangkokensis]OLR91303.1 lactate dehydrogenase [Actinokineospora bangkokensis]